MSDHVETARFSRDDLVAVPVSGVGVCEVCAAPSDGPRCRSCVAALGTTWPTDISVAIITLTDPRGAVGTAARVYKDSLDPSARDLAARKLGWLTQRFMSRHEQCLAGASQRFDVIVPMPQDGSLGSQPLAWLLEEQPWATGRVRQAASCVRNRSLAANSVDPGRFAIDREAVEGRNVLLVDDVWLTGASAMSAALALRMAGAATVTVMTLARFVPLQTLRAAEPTAWNQPLNAHVCRACPRAPGVMAM